MTGVAVRGTVSRAVAAALIAALATIAGVAPAAADQGAIHLGAGDCYAAGSSTAALTNSCQSNTGLIKLVASFTPPVMIPQFCGLEAVVNVFSAGTTLSPWWHMESSPSPGCRAGRISVSFDFTSGPGTCEDYWAGRAMGGMDYGVNKDGLGPNSARILMICAVDETTTGPINPPTEYYGFSIVIQRSQSSGVGSCEGCLDKACFALSYITLGQVAPLPEYTITQGVQQVVPYNGGGGPNCAIATTQKSSWGAIKSIFRY